jgi:hypothetical protein
MDLKQREAKREINLSQGETHVNKVFKSVRSSRMFITKNIGVDEKVPIYSVSKTHPTIKVRVVCLFDVKASDAQRYQCRSYDV